MSEIYNKVKDMSRGDKTAYFKTITEDQKKAYDNYMNYQRVLKNRNKDRKAYNDYMKPIKNKSRANNKELYRIQNNKDVANYRARRNLTPDDASKVISNNIKNYIAKLKAIKEVNEEKKITIEEPQKKKGSSIKYADKKKLAIEPISLHPFHY